MFEHPMREHRLYSFREHRIRTRRVSEKGKSVTVAYRVRNTFSKLLNYHFISFSKFAAADERRASPWASTVNGL